MARHQRHDCNREYLISQFSLRAANATTMRSAATPGQSPELLAPPAKAPVKVPTRTIFCRKCWRGSHKIWRGSRLEEALVLSHKMRRAVVATARSIDAGTRRNTHRIATKSH